MFEGTLRSNLDPFEQYEDRKLLEALDKCLLRDLVEHNPLGLRQLVASMGQNYSLGQQVQFAIYTGLGFSS
jgi:ABC-type multidrug transport system fused ATPase/permease subunit